MSGCKAYTYVKVGWSGVPACYLKSAVGERRPTAGVVSASVGMNPAPTPTPTQTPSPRPSPPGSLEVNIDYWGNDLSTLYDISQADCYAKCAAMSGCKAYTYVKVGWSGVPACYLKSAVGERRPTAGVVSATVTTPAPTCSTPAWGNCGNQFGAKCCPSGQYCQAWDAWNYWCIQTPSKCSRQFTDIDFYGNDLPQGTVYGLSPHACCTKCTQTTGCKAYTFVNANPDGRTACYLKSSAAGKVKSTGAVSGLVN
ncbi:Cellulose binding elicitor lectin, partial [Globisporangium splendens]